MTTADDTESPPRLLTDAEIGGCVRVFRELHGWSQEQLAEISGLSVRTIQRIEKGQPANLHTRRALGHAFEFEDADALNKPFSIPTEAQLKARKEKFDREHVTLTAHPVTTGRQLATLVENHMMDLSEPGFDMEREAAEAFAVLVDYIHDYRDCASEYAQTMKLEVYDELQSQIDALKDLGVSLRYAERRLMLTFGSDSPGAKPMATSALYLVGFRLGHEPDSFVTPRKAGIKF
ncbi:helix-turn-helix transcriptional regulator [Roseateles sp. NT4]|uniref:helix-turn-helix transcriptional regulator n=1 Tax=Roseateles sp. NT4 TaxID=3453715 RepID=UPI003EEA62FF